MTLHWAPAGRHGSGMVFVCLIVCSFVCFFVWLFVCFILIVILFVCTFFLLLQRRALFASVTLHWALGGGHGSGMVLVCFIVCYFVCYFFVQLFVLFYFDCNFVCFLFVLFFFAVEKGTFCVCDSAQGTGGRARVRNGAAPRYVIALHLDWEYRSHRHDLKII